MKRAGILVTSRCMKNSLIELNCELRSNKFIHTNRSMQQLSWCKSKSGNFVKTSYANIDVKFPNYMCQIFRALKRWKFFIKVSDVDSMFKTFLSTVSRAISRETVELYCHIHCRNLFIAVIQMDQLIHGSVSLVSF